MLKTAREAHLTENDIAAYLTRAHSRAWRRVVAEHLAVCDECLLATAAAHEAVAAHRETGHHHRKGLCMKKLNLSVVLATIAFLLSFAIPRYFIQLLVATLILGLKWVIDAKTTRMLIMIHEAWKKGGEEEASRVIGQMGREMSPAHRGGRMKMLQKNEPKFYNLGSDEEGV